MEIVLLAIVVGIGVGVVVGALGAGGGILSVPVLVFLLGMPVHSATASSLVIVMISALVSMPHHARRGNIEWRSGLVFGAGTVIAAVAGSRLSALVPAQLLLLLLAILLTVVAAVMLRRALRTRREERAAEDAHTAQENRGTGRADDGTPADGTVEDDAPDDDAEPVASHDDPVLDQPGPDTVEMADGTRRHHGEVEQPAARRSAPRMPVLIAAATLTGLLTGFFGVGGGFIVVPMLVLALGLAMRQASGTSLMVMVIVTGVSMLARIGTDVQVDWATTLVFAGGSALGAMLGGPLSAKARPSTLTLLFALLLGAVAAVTFVQTLL
jgi:hypothetical protein